MSNVTKYRHKIGRQCGPDGEVDVKTDPDSGDAGGGGYGPTIMGKTGPALPKTELIHKI